MHDVSSFSLRHIQAILAVEESGSISKGATIISLSQPQTSRLIAEAERLVQAKLFERTSTGIQPTGVGKAAIGQLRTLGYSIEKTLERVAETRSTYLPEIRVGYTSISYGHGLAILGRYFRDRKDDTLLLPIQMKGLQVMTALERGEIDLAIMHPPERGGTLASVAFKDDVMDLVVPKGFTDTDRALSELPLVVPPVNVWPSLYSRFISQLNERNITPNFLERSVDGFTALTIVNGGKVATILPQTMRRLAPERVDFLPLFPDHPLTLPSAIVCAKPAPAGLNGFLTDFDDWYRSTSSVGS